jgi:uracil-DNA glycosylase
VWLDADVDAVQPTAIVCLGATAAQTLLGRSVRVTKVRGERIDSPLAPVVMATVHPSAILRARTDADRARERKAFQADLVRLASHLRHSPGGRKLYKRNRVSRTRSARTRNAGSA